MPPKPPRLCADCGTVHPTTLLCRQQVERERARKARFDATRPTARERGYTSEWEHARAAFLRDHPLCRRCGEPATTVDHTIAHRGDRAVFWNRSNWQPLCDHCHNSHKQRVERRLPKIRLDAARRPPLASTSRATKAIGNRPQDHQRIAQEARLFGHSRQLKVENRSGVATQASHWNASKEDQPNPSADGHKQSQALHSKSSTDRLPEVIHA